MYVCRCRANLHSGMLTQSWASERVILTLCWLWPDVREGSLHDHKQIIQVSMLVWIPGRPSGQTYFPGKYLVCLIHQWASAYMDTPSRGGYMAVHIFIEIYGGYKCTPLKFLERIADFGNGEKCFNKVFIHFQKIAKNRRVCYVCKLDTGEFYSHLGSSFLLCHPPLSARTPL